MTPCWAGAEALTANLVLTFQRFVSWSGFMLMVRTSNEVSLGLISEFPEKKNNQMPLHKLPKSFLEHRWDVWLLETERSLKSKGYITWMDTSHWSQQKDHQQMTPQAEIWWLCSKTNQFLLSGLFPHLSSAFEFRAACQVSVAGCCCGTLAGLEIMVSSIGSPRLV